MITSKRRLGVQLDHRRRHRVVAGQLDDEGRATLDGVVDVLTGGARAPGGARCRGSRQPDDRSELQGDLQPRSPGDTRLASWCQKMVIVRLDLVDERLERLRLGLVGRAPRRSTGRRWPDLGM